MRDNILKLAPITLCNSQQDVVDNIRRLADEIVGGEFGDVKTIIAIIETKDGLITHQNIGERCDLARAVGLMAIETIRSTIDKD